MPNGKDEQFIKGVLYEIKNKGIPAWDDKKIAEYKKIMDTRESRSRALFQAKAEVFLSRLAKGLPKNDCDKLIDRIINLDNQYAVFEDIIKHMDYNFLEESESVLLDAFCGDLGGNRADMNDMQSSLEDIKSFIQMRREELGDSLNYELNDEEKEAQQQNYIELVNQYDGVILSHFAKAYPMSEADYQYAKNGMLFDQSGDVKNMEKCVDFLLTDLGQGLSPDEFKAMGHRIMKNKELRNVLLDFVKFGTGKIYDRNFDSFKEAVLNEDPEAIATIRKAVNLEKQKIGAGFKQEEDKAEEEFQKLYEDIYSQPRLDVSSNAKAERSVQFDLSYDRGSEGYLRKMSIVLNMAGISLNEQNYDLMLVKVQQNRELHQTLLDICDYAEYSWLNIHRRELITLFAQGVYIDKYESDPNLAKAIIDSYIEGRKSELKPEDEELQKEDEKKQENEPGEEDGEEYNNEDPFKVEQLSPEEIIARRVAPWEKKVAPEEKIDDGGFDIEGMDGGKIHIAPPNPNLFKNDNDIVIAPPNVPNYQDYLNGKNKEEKIVEDENIINTNVNQDQVNHNDHAVILDYSYDHNISEEDLTGKGDVPLSYNNLDLSLELGDDGALGTDVKTAYDWIDELKANLRANEDLDKDDLSRCAARILAARILVNSVRGDGSSLRKNVNGAAIDILAEELLDEDFLLSGFLETLNENQLRNLLQKSGHGGVFEDKFKDYILKLPAGELKTDRIFDRFMPRTIDRIEVLQKQAKEAIRDERSVEMQMSEILLLRAAVGAARKDKEALYNRVPTVFNLSKDVKELVKKGPVQEAAFMPSVRADILEGHGGLMALNMARSDANSFTHKAVVEADKLANTVHRFNEIQENAKAIKRQLGLELYSNKNTGNMHLLCQHARDIVDQSIALSGIIHSDKHGNPATSPSLAAVQKVSNGFKNNHTIKNTLFPEGTPKELFKQISKIADAEHVDRDYATPTRTVLQTALTLEHPELANHNRPVNNNQPVNSNHQVNNQPKHEMKPGGF